MQLLEQLSREIFKRYGFAEVRLPTFEDSALFTRSIGEATDIIEKEMYVFKDRKGRDLALRPEGTAGAVRLYVEHALGQYDAVNKYFYSGSMFRYERPQAGRYREFTQADIDIVGANVLAERRRGDFGETDDVLDNPVVVTIKHGVTQILHI